MSKPQLKPILNASLPAQFRQIRIALAREPGHPEGDDDVAYIFVAPVDAEGRSIRNYGGRIAKPAVSHGSVQTSKTSMVISSITRAAPGDSTMTAKPICPTKPVIISRTNVLSLANMSRSTSAAGCTPIA
jgi:hypothetical protein